MNLYKIELYLNCYNVDLQTIKQSEIFVYELF